MKNRINNYYYSPKNIHEVISADYQYSAYDNQKYKAAVEYSKTGSISNRYYNNKIEISDIRECVDVIIPIYNNVELKNHSDWAYDSDYKFVYIPGTEGFWWYTWKK